MKNITSYQGKNILVLGLGKSGYETAKLLHVLGANVTVNDGKDVSLTNEAKELEAVEIKVVSGHHPIELLGDIDLIIKNPGIPYRIPFIQEAIARNIQIITEVELAYEINEGKIIGITGTNGKTTVTSLIGDMFKHSNQTGLLCGNIGFVASLVAQNAKSEDTLITELSSFQLMGIRHFKPHIALITNIYSAHLDYHGTQDEYVSAKLNIVKNQTAEDYLIFNYKQKELLNNFKIDSQIIYFSTEEKVNGSYIVDGKIYFQNEFIINVDEVVLPGKHNLENILSSIAAAKLSDIPNESIIATLKSFEGIKHRLQFVMTHENVKYFNDSKATNTLATTFALDAFHSPIHWLCGGLDRGNGFEDLDEHVSNVKHMYIFGQTTEKLKAFAELHHIPYSVCDDVKDAVLQTKGNTVAGDTVLLSPACASWDQYPTYEVRGEDFIQQVKLLQ
ncbi:UDP-N-acetylmuramoyl-L-alanine--D-glutamate ligase [Macrococcoides goetzii]|nr:UDP-N-acetylmuramoyl-L-alanine--D-glutamate ligase [Macrococcus goetzii]TDM42047.1 UDP-N-acetylmuramoyl-L-alanine--D-glutamate ligase [Macrococcus goetzii]TDM48001.1 UDP-N-acetylmuramoyl-L-alanine--D-glutamate ligase [Macrococcus goetzii]TDM50904.1 UDP-N-acetylmuramoyl-L-alanine--D-glutamate ligase [Macrococcus goetzii]